MSLPHWLYECDCCDFLLSSGPDDYRSTSNSREDLWGRLCACVGCGLIHFVGKPSSLPQTTHHSLYFRTERDNGKKGNEWKWLKTEQDFECVVHHTTPGHQGGEDFDISQAACTACGRHDLKFSLYPGLECPLCKAGKIVETFTGE
jgi:hypothetical protein